jgi:hypothetical protein
MFPRSRKTGRTRHQPNDDHQQCARAHTPTVTRSSPAQRRKRDPRWIGHDRPRAITAQTGSDPFSFRERVGFDANSALRSNSPEELLAHNAELRPPADAGVLPNRHGSSPARQASSVLSNTCHDHPRVATTQVTQIRAETDRVRFDTIFHYSRKSSGPSSRNAAIRRYNTRTDNHESPVRQTGLN